MRILYGINAQQQGHFARAETLVPLLRERGHVVQTISSGLAPVRGAAQPAWMDDAHRHFLGLPYIEHDGRTDAKATAMSWARRLPKLMAARSAVQRLARDFRPDGVLSDFELFTGGLSLGLDCPTVSACRQTALLDPAIPLPPGDAEGKGLTRTVVRLFTLAADRRLSYHFAPQSPRCLPPMLRADVLRRQPSDGDFLLVYNSQHFGDGGDAASLLAWAAATGCPVKAYGYADQPRGQQGRVEFRPPGRDAMLDDLAACRAVASTAGFALPLEAAIYGKPCVVTPLPGQWEQTVNAYQLGQLGWAKPSPRWDFDLALASEPATLSDRDRHWILTPADRIVDAILASLDT